MAERIYVFIPVYYREKTVRVAIESMLKTYRSPGYEVRLIFIDNKSNDSLRLFLKDVAKENEDVKLMLLDKNEGKSNAITMATEKHNNFQWFVNCDSDISLLTEGWPGLLVDCYKSIPRAGMVSVNYVNNGNAPMPKQPQKMALQVGEHDFVFCYGGQVAGGCFATQREVWDDIGYHRSKGVYGGIDGLFRQSVAESLMRKCGFIRTIMAEHLDDRDENKEYNLWKASVQDKIREFSPLADAKKLGNNRGYWDK